MSDDVDLSEEKSSLLLQSEIQEIMKKAEKIKPGEAGECERCGDESLRLIESKDKSNAIYKACARCRDKYQLTTL